MTRTVLQPPGTFACLGCVAAMITWEDLADVAAFVGHDGSRRPFRMTEVVAYLATCGYLVGAYADRPWKPRKFIAFEWATNIPAVLIVANARGDNHAVYWTGRQVLDPAPENFGKTLQQYTVREWWPVLKVEE